jgi:predicted GNAT family N-acyltransferase
VTGAVADDAVAGAASGVRIALCAPVVLHDLRLRVLRPGQPRSSVDHEHDYWPDTFHVGAFDPDGVVVACATLYPEPNPQGRPGWRLRGMATAPEVRGKGYGAGVLRFGIDEVRNRGGSLVWCNARAGAVWFYERLGFIVVSDEFEIPPIGPHYVMEYEVS